MNRQLFASCNKTVIRTSHHHINSQNSSSNNNMLSMNMPGGYTSSPMPSSGQARWDERLEEESQRTYSPWSGRLVFAKTRKEENNNGLADERNECTRRGSTSSNDQSGFSEHEDEVQHIKTITRNIHDVDTYDGIHKNDPGTGSSLLIDRIIDLTLSPSPSGSKSRISDRNEQMITPIRARPRVVARYASPECRTAMSPLKPRFNGPAQPQPKVGSKTLHPFFNPPTAAYGSPTSPLPPLSHAPRLSMRTLQPGSQSTESATSSSQASTSTYTSTSTGTSSTTTSPGSYRRPVQVLRGLQNSRVVIEERITTGHRDLWTWGQSREVEKVPDDLILDFDALNLDAGAVPKSATTATPSKVTTNVPPKKATTLVKPKVALAPKPAEPEIAPEPVIPRRPVNKAFFDVQDLPFFSYKSLKPPPTIVYTCCPDETDDLLPLLKGDVVGFDMEWPVNYRRYKGSTKATKLNDKTALIQICDDKIVLLLHLSKMRCESMSFGLAKSCRYTTILIRYLLCSISYSAQEPDQR
jgi:hypothetical protein